MKLNTLTLTQALTYIKEKKISIGDLYRDVQSEIAGKNTKLNIYLAMDPDPLVKARKESNKPLMGLPLAVKDNFLTVGLETTASSKVNQGFMPPYESTVTKRLKDAGGVVIGKTNMDAWAHGSSTETSDFGPVKNPHNPDHVPGGSSGGSAAAVAADMCMGAIGSETAGSIRVPAAWCGVVGLKPTYGRVPRTGIIAMGSSLDSPGPLTKSVEDAALLYGIIAGHDRYDATTVKKPVRPYDTYLFDGVKGYRVGICYMDYPDLQGKTVDRLVHQAADVFRSLGATVDEIPLSKELRDNRILTPEYAIAVYTIVQRSEVSSNLARHDGIRYGNDRSFFATEAKRRIMLGTFALSKGYAEKYYVRAEQVRNLYRENFRQLFSKYDILISTAVPGTALKLGESAGNPMFGELCDVLNEPSSLAGISGISVPCAWDDVSGLPYGLTIMGNHWQEEKVLRAAYAYEKNTKWSKW